MPMIVTPRTRTRPPAGALRVNRGNPLGARARWISAPGIDGGRFDGRETITQGAVRSTVRDWPAATFTAGAVVIAPGTFPHAPGTIVAACRLDKDLDGGFGYVMGCDYNGTDEPLALRMLSQQLQLSAYYPSGGGTFGHSVAALSDGEYVLLFGRVNGASSAVGVVSLDAATKRPTVSATSGSIGTSPGWTSRNFFIGHGLQGGVGYWRRYAQPIALVGWLDGLVPDEQLISLWDNPWQLFAPVRRPVFFAAGGGVYDVALSEVASASESLGASGALTSALAEAASAADVVSAAAAFAAAMSEAATAGDSSAGSTVRAGALGEAAAVGDALTASATLAGSISEAVTASDVISSSGALLAALSEAASAADAIDGSVGAATYSATLAEAASAGDAWSSAAVIAGAIVEAVTAGDTVASIATMAAAITEVAASTDQVSSATTMAAAISEAVTAADAWSGSVGAAVLTASITEAVTAGDVFAALELLARFGVRGARGVSVQANARRAQLQRSVRRN